MSLSLSIKKLLYIKNTAVTLDQCSAEDGEDVKKRVSHTLVGELIVDHRFFQRTCAEID